MRGRKNPDKVAANHLPPCRVCGESSTGFHYGVITCIACKGFFRRSLARIDPYPCTQNQLCHIGTCNKRRQLCPKCRYDKCIKVGMSREGCKVGRYSRDKKHEYKKEAIEIEKRIQHGQSNSSTPPPSSAAAEALSSPSSSSRSSSSFLSRPSSAVVCSSEDDTQFQQTGHERPIINRKSNSSTNNENIASSSSSSLCSSHSHFYKTKPGFFQDNVISREIDDDNDDYDDDDGRHRHLSDPPSSEADDDDDNHDDDDDKDDMDIVVDDIGDEMLEMLSVSAPEDNRNDNECDGVDNHSRYNDTDSQMAQRFSRQLNNYGSNPESNNTFSGKFMAKSICNSQRGQPHTNKGKQLNPHLQPCDETTTTSSSRSPAENESLITPCCKSLISKPMSANSVDVLPVAVKSSPSYSVHSEGSSCFIKEKITYTTLEPFCKTSVLADDEMPPLKTPPCSIAFTATPFPFHKRGTALSSTSQSQLHDYKLHGNITRLPYSINEPNYTDQNNSSLKTPPCETPIPRFSVPTTREIVPTTLESSSSAAVTAERAISPLPPPKKCEADSSSLTLKSPPCRNQNQHSGHDSYTSMHENSRHTTTTSEPAYPNKFQCIEKLEEKPQCSYPVTSMDSAIKDHDIHLYSQQSPYFGNFEFSKEWDKPRRFPYPQARINCFSSRGDNYPSSHNLGNNRDAEIPVNLDSPCQRFPHSSDTMDYGVFVDADVTINPAGSSPIPSTPDGQPFLYCNNNNNNNTTNSFLGFGSHYSKNINNASSSEVRENMSTRNGDRVGFLAVDGSGSDVITHAGSNSILESMETNDTNSNTDYPISINNNNDNNRNNTCPTSAFSPHPILFPSSFLDVQDNLYPPLGSPLSPSHSSSPSPSFFTSSVQTSSSDPPTTTSGNISPHFNHNSYNTNPHSTSTTSSSILQPFPHKNLNTTINSSVSQPLPTTTHLKTKLTPEMAARILSVTQNRFQLLSFEKQELLRILQNGYIDYTDKSSLPLRTVNRCSNECSREDDAILKHISHSSSPKKNSINNSKGSEFTTGDDEVQVFDYRDKVVWPTSSSVSNTSSSSVSLSSQTSSSSSSSSSSLSSSSLSSSSSSWIQDIVYDPKEMDILLEQVLTQHDRFYSNLTSITPTEMKRAQDAYWNTFKLYNSLCGPLQLVDDEYYFHVFDTTGVDVDRRKAYVLGHIDCYDKWTVRDVRFFKNLPGFKNLLLQDRTVLIKACMSVYEYLKDFRGWDRDRGIWISEDGLMAYNIETCLKVLPHIRDTIAGDMAVYDELQDLDLSHPEFALLRATMILSPCTFEPLEQPEMVKECYDKYLACLLHVTRKTRGFGAGPEADERFYKLVRVLDRINSRRAHSRKFMHRSVNYLLKLLKSENLLLFRELFAYFKEEEED